MLASALALLEAKSLSWTPDSARRFCLELVPDAYVSSVNVSRSLTSDPIRRVVSDGERATGWWLFRRLAFPRDLSLGLGAGPAPIGGWAVREWAPSVYREATWRGQNLIQAATEGHPDPWSISLFLGNVVQLVPGNDSSRITGMGYGGYQVSWGAWTLADNRLIQDHWVDLEAKLEGEDIRRERIMGWSFRGGLREHVRPEIRDILHGSIVRSRTDFTYRGWNPLRNSSLEVRLDIDRESLADLPSLDVVRWSAVAGKKFPFADGRMAWSLSVGAVQELLPAFTGSLRSKAPRGWGLVLQPNLEW